MSTTNRREFLVQMGAAIVATRLPAQSPSYDLLIAGGRVIDPMQKISGDR